MKTVYLTKFWESQGIIKLEVEAKNCFPTFIKDGINRYKRTDCFFTIDEAIKDFEKKKANKIKKLEKELNYLKSKQYKIC